MDLRNDCARTDDFSPLAPGVASSTDIIQPAEGLGQVIGLWQRALTGRFPCAIKIEDHPLAARSIHQVPDLVLVGKWATEEVLQKERAEGFDGFLGQCCQKARKG